MMRGLIFVTLMCGCGGVHSPLAEQRVELSAQEEQTDAAVADPLRTPAITVRFPNAPADLPTDNVRAALVWTDTLGQRPGPGDTIKANPSIRSDTAVTDVSQFELLVESAPGPNLYKDYENHPGSSPELRDADFHSLPIAEVVLYHDANQNGVLDLVPLGEPGPSPDTILALSSGHDAQGNAKRNLLANKKSPLSIDTHISIVPGINNFRQPLPPGTHLGDGTGNYPDDGLYIVSITAAPKDVLAQASMLSGYVERTSWVGERADPYYLNFVLGEIQSAKDSALTLYSVDPKREAWLARGCVPHLLDGQDISPVPPPGAAIQCNPDQLLYSTSPDHFCGQVTGLMKYEWEMQTSEPWPCGPRGLIEGSPYVNATKRLDGDPLMLESRVVLLGESGTYPPPDWSCDPDVLYDFDINPAWRFPSIAPEPGSQVQCYGRNSLSYVPARADGCSFKYSYDLSSEYYKELVPFMAYWDLRDEPPAWWPCDERGELQAGTTYVAARKPQPASCYFRGPEAVSYVYPPPPNSEVHCISYNAYQFRPLWADSCDGYAIVKMNSENWSSMVDPWPCDKDGKFIPRAGLSEY